MKNPINNLNATTADVEPRELYKNLSYNVTDPNLTTTNYTIPLDNVDVESLYQACPNLSTAIEVLSRNLGCYDSTAQLLSKAFDRVDVAENNNVPANVRAFKAVVRMMAATYQRKNADYGDSFSRSIEKYGPIAALTRMSDKWNRLENIMMGGKQLVGDESVLDTLLDLASYAVMTYVALKGNDNDSNQ